MKPFSFYKRAPLAKIERMEFSMMSEKEIKENAVVHVFDSELNEGTDLDTPKCYGLNDHRMFPPGVSKKAVCRTDMNTSEDCPGFFGYMTLADAVYWPQHIDRVYETLRCVCIHCSALLLEPSKKAETAQRYRNMSFAKRYEQIRHLINNATGRKVCPYCKLPQPKYEKSNQREGIKMIYCRFADAQGNLAERSRMLRPIEVQNVLRKVTKEDAELLGFAPTSRPESMITKLFPVPPPCIRPASKGDGNQRSEDDLTRLLIHMLRHSESMREQQRARNGIPDEEWDQKLLLLQCYVSAYVNNECKGNKRLLRAYGSPTKSIMERIRGKAGRIRNNLMGKRVNYSARTVITGDPYLSVDEVGVPLQIAMHITFPEVVTPYNLERLRTMVRNGPHKYPGAVLITSRDAASNFTRRLDFMTEDPADKLGVGMVVHRHLLNGDFVLFNRQPSLHRMSMMAHRVRVLPGKTFRLQLAVVKPYNADSTSKSATGSGLARLF